MKICVFGAGAIGGYLAVQLATAGHDVCVGRVGLIFAPSRSTGSNSSFRGRRK